MLVVGVATGTTVKVLLSGELIEFDGRVCCLICLIEISLTVLEGEMVMVQLVRVIDCWADVVIAFVAEVVISYGLIGH